MQARDIDLRGETLYGKGHDNRGLARAFQWLTKNGMGRHFPGMPIHWYQMHQIAALDVIRDKAAAAGASLAKVRVRHGIVEANHEDGLTGAKTKWVRLASTREVFELADKKTRAGETSGASSKPRSGVQPAEHRIVTTFSRVTPLDDGSDYPYEEEHGWIDEEGRTIDADSTGSYVEDAVRFLRDEGAIHASSTQFHKGIWYSTEYSTTDYGTGEEEERSFHLKGFTEEEEREVYDALKRRKVVMEARESRARARDYVAVGSDGKKVGGPYKNYDEAKKEADRAGGYVQYAFEGAAELGRAWQIYYIVDVQHGCAVKGPIHPVDEADRILKERYSELRTDLGPHRAPRYQVINSRFLTEYAFAPHCKGAVPEGPERKDPSFWIATEAREDFDRFADVLEKAVKWGATKIQSLDPSVHQPFNRESERFYVYRPAAAHPATQWQHRELFKKEGNWHLGKDTSKPAMSRPPQGAVFIKDIAKSKAGGEAHEKKDAPYYRELLEEDIDLWADGTLPHQGIFAARLLADAGVSVHDIEEAEKSDDLGNREALADHLRHQVQNAAWYQLEEYIAHRQLALGAGERRRRSNPMAAASGIRRKTPGAQPGGPFGMPKIHEARHATHRAITQLAYLIGMKRHTDEAVDAAQKLRYVVETQLKGRGPFLPRTIANAIMNLQEAKALLVRYAYVETTEEEREYLREAEHEIGYAQAALRDYQAGRAPHYTPHENPVSEDDLVAKLRAMTIGSTLDIPPSGYIRRHERAAWSLNDRNNRLRNRWGNAEQIAEDARYYTAHGELPPPLGRAFENPAPRGGGSTDYGDIGVGSRVTIVDQFGKEHTGRAVMLGPAGWVLNMGGRHGTPQVATLSNFVRVSGRGRRDRRFDARENPDLRMIRGQGRRPNYDQFTQAYFEAALFAEIDDKGEPLDKNHSIASFAVPTRDAMLADAECFEAEHYEEIQDDLTRAGHDFWLTRNGHGAGFWDGDWPEEVGERLTRAAKAYGPFELYVGDDGMIYAAGHERPKHLRRVKEGGQANERVPVVYEKGVGAPLQAAEAMPDVDIEPIEQGGCVPWVKVTRDPKKYESCLARAKKLGPVDTPEKVYELLRGTYDQEDQEVFLVVLTDIRGQLRGVAEVARGQRSRVSVDTVDILRVVVTSGAEGFTVCHNHPSGSPKPSKSDKDLTRSIKTATDALNGGKGMSGVTFFDHVVCGMKKYHSIRESNPELFK